MLDKTKPYLKNIESKFDEWHKKSPQVRWTISAYALYVRNLMGDKDITKTKKLLAEAGIEKMPFEAIGWILSVLADDKNSTVEVEAIKRFLMNRTTETAATANFVTDYGDGAWLVILLIPTFVGIMLFVHRQYAEQAQELHVRDDIVIPGPHRTQRVVIPVPGINRAVVQAVNFARAIGPDVRGVYVTDDIEEGEELRRRWARQFPDVTLVLVDSPYRALIGPFVAYLDVLDREWPTDQEAPITIVVLPEYVARHWWERLLYNQTAKRLKQAILGREHTVIADVPYRRE